MLWNANLGQTIFYFIVCCKERMFAWKWGRKKRQPSQSNEWLNWILDWLKRKKSTWKKQ